MMHSNLLSSYQGFEQFTVREFKPVFRGEKNFDFTYTRLMRSDGLPSRLGIFFVTQKKVQDLA